MVAFAAYCLPRRCRSHLLPFHPYVCDVCLPTSPPCPHLRGGFTLAVTWQFALALCPLRLRPQLPPPTSPPPYLLSTRQASAWPCLHGISRCRQFASADASYSSPLPGLYTFPPAHPFPREQGIALSRAAPWFRRGAVLAPFPFRVIQSSRFLSLGGATWFATLCVV